MHDGPVLSDANTLDPAGAVTARTVEAGPSQVGEGAPDLEEDEAVDIAEDETGKRKKDNDVSTYQGLTWMMH